MASEDWFLRLDPYNSDTEADFDGCETPKSESCVEPVERSKYKTADFCTAFMPDSDGTEPTEQSSSGEASGAWKKYKTADLRRVMQTK